MMTPSFVKTREVYVVEGRSNYRSDMLIRFVKTE